MFQMLWNILKDGLCYLQNESVPMKIFLLNLHKATYFILSGQSYMSFNLLCISIFFYKTTGLAYPQAVNVEEACVMAT